MKRLVIDTETTGLSHNYHKTLTVGMLLIDVEKDFLDILDENHIFIKHHNYNMDPEAHKVHKIDMEEHAKKATTPQIACSQINNFVERNNLGDTLLIGHNISFDRGFLNALFNQGETTQTLHPFHEDTMHFWNKLKRSGEVPYNLRSTLGTLAEFFKIDYSKGHDALADCHITAKVYHNLLKIKPFY